MFYFNGDLNALRALPIAKSLSLGSLRTFSFFVALTSIASIALLTLYVNQFFGRWWDFLLLTFTEVWCKFVWYWCPKHLCFLCRFIFLSLDGKCSASLYSLLEYLHHNYQFCSTHLSPLANRTTMFHIRLLLKTLSRYKSKWTQHVIH